MRSEDGGDESQPLDGTRPLYISKNPKQTFQEFILGVLIQQFGQDWWGAQESLPLPDQHFVVRCAAALQRWRDERAAEALEMKPGVWTIPAEGMTQYVLALAYDVACLVHNASLHDELLARLRNRQQFQGARYEVAVAAIFARIGCDVRFLENQSEKHPEFVARFEPSGEEVAVEAKSRHRAGVIHHPGEIDEQAVVRGDVRRLLKEALEQNPGDLPFMVFVDVNTPPVPNRAGFDGGWFRDVRNVLDGYTAPTREEPDSFTALFFTSYSYQYQAGEIATRGGQASVWPMYVKYPVDAELRSRLIVAVSNYGRIPDLDVDEESVRQPT